MVARPASEGPGRSATTPDLFGAGASRPVVLPPVPSGAFVCAAEFSAALRFAWDVTPRGRTRLPLTFRAGRAPRSAHRGKTRLGRAFLGPTGATLGLPVGKRDCGTRFGADGAPLASPRANAPASRVCSATPRCARDGASWTAEPGRRDRAAAPRRPMLSTRHIRRPTLAKSDPSASICRLGSTPRPGARTPATLAR
jgi:hypothetical protein